MHKNSIFRRLCKTLKVILLCIVTLFILVTGTKATIHYTGQPAFCKSCHVMQPFYDSWSKSAHKNVNCYACHTEKGTLGLVKVKIKGIRDVYLTLLNVPTQPKDERAFDRCIECHQKIKPLQNADLKFSHSKHTEAGYNCSYCHAKVVHGSKTKPTMQLCINCHASNQEKNAPTSNCLACHKKKNGKPDSHKLNSWTLSHGKTFLKENKYCIVCHVKGTQEPLCRNCHKIAMPHSTDWLSQHADKSSTNNKNCLVCHKYDRQPRKAAPCLSCHGTEMPHPKNWTVSHGQAVNTINCSYCHTSTNPANPYADWASPKYCVNCHTTKNPHSPNWIYEHGTRQFPINKCAFCHNINSFCSRCHFGE